MRNGILLAEDSPPNILRTLNANSLEDAFLALCMRQGSSEEADATFTRADSIRRRLPQGEQDPELVKGFPKKQPVARNQSFQETKPQGLKGTCQITTKKRMKALMTKNILQLIRQPGLVVRIQFSWKGHNPFLLFSEELSSVSCSPSSN